jgi:CPA2 family monovalent cation:H+ antiporter-2
MMIDPAILREHFGVVVAITLLTIVGKLLGSGFGAVLSGRSLKQSVQAGMSLAQIGEFSFIIATLGVTLNATSDFLYPIVVAVSAVTTFTTPYMIRHSGSIYAWIEARLPRRFIELMEKYERAMMRTDAQERPIRLLWRIYGLAALLNSVVIIAIGLASSRILLPYLIETLGDGRLMRFFACIATLIASAPFLYALALKSPRKLSNEHAVTLERLRNLQLGAWLLRIVIALILIALIISQFATTIVLPLIVLVATPFLLVVFRKFIERFYLAVEDRFLANLNAKELAAIESISHLPQLAPWNATLARFTLSSDSGIAGKSLEEARFRTLTGATIAMIDRGQRRIFAPSRSEKLLPTDQIFLIGTDDQLAAAQALMDTKETGTPLSHDEAFNLESVVIGENSGYVNKSIREIGMGADLGALIVGIERKGRRILNPESTQVLEPGDLIWVFGRRDRIKGLSQV